MFNAFSDDGLFSNIMPTLPLRDGRRCGVDIGEGSLDVVDKCCALIESEMVMEYFAEICVPIVWCVVRSQVCIQPQKMLSSIPDLS